MYAFLMEWKRPLNYFPVLVMVHQYIGKFVEWLFGFLLLLLLLLLLALFLLV